MEIHPVEIRVAAAYGSAEAEFQKITQNRGWAVRSLSFALAHLELVCDRQLKNDAENAQGHFERFADLWKNTHQDLSFINYQKMSKRAHLADSF